MPDIWYIAVEKFDPSSGGKWIDYLRWARLPQLKEVVSLDHILCPSLIQEFTDEDWKYNVQEDYLISFFTDIEYLRTRLADRLSINILAVMREPSRQAIQSFTDDRFVFQGYDLIEQPGGGISAISNCGGFERAFKPTDVSAVGLFDSYEFARLVQQRLMDNYPGEPHARCYLWAIWKMKN